MNGEATNGEATREPTNGEVPMNGEATNGEATREPTNGEATRENEKEKEPTNGDATQEQATKNEEQDEKLLTNVHIIARSEFPPDIVMIATAVEAATFTIIKGGSETFFAELRKNHEFQTGPGSCLVVSGDFALDDYESTLDLFEGLETMHVMSSGTEESKAMLRRLTDHKHGEKVKPFFPSDHMKAWPIRESAVCTKFYKLVWVYHFCHQFPRMSARFVDEADALWRIMNKDTNPLKRVIFAAVEQGETDGGSYIRHAISEGGAEIKWERAVCAKRTRWYSTPRQDHHVVGALAPEFPEATLDEILQPKDGHTPTEAVAFDGKWAWVRCLPKTLSSSEKDAMNDDELASWDAEEKKRQTDGATSMAATIFRSAPKQNISIIETYRGIVVKTPAMISEFERSFV